MHVLIHIQIRVVNTNLFWAVMQAEFGVREVGYSPLSIREGNMLTLSAYHASSSSHLCN